MIFASMELCRGLKILKNSSHDLMIRDLCIRPHSEQRAAGCLSSGSNGAFSADLGSEFVDLGGFCADFRIFWHNYPVGVGSGMPNSCRNFAAFWMLCAIAAVPKKVRFLARPRKRVRDRP